jgi:hypothetical protein
MATLVIRLRDIDHYPQEEWDIGSVLAKRRWLIKTLPINSPEITKLDVWLLKQPDLYPEDVLDIWSRTLYCFWLAYRDPDIDNLTKHFILLALKEEFEDFCRLSEFDQERLWPNFSRWRATFKVEEMIASGQMQFLSKGGCDGTA